MLGKNLRQRSLRDFWSIFFLIINTFPWYYMVLRIRDNILSIPEMSKYSVIANIVFSCSIAIASLLGALLSSKVARDRLLLIWITVGVAISLLPVTFIYDHSILAIVIVFSILGSGFGFGIPSCLSYFGNIVTIEKRGLFAGIIFLIVQLLLIPIVALLSGLDIFSSSLFLAVWRAFGLLFLVSRVKEKPMLHTKSQSSYISILRAKPFLLYFLPWFSYSLLDAFESVVLSNFLKRDIALSNSIEMIGILLSFLSVLLGGFFADQIGRKRIVIYGFTVLGFGYAAVGLLPNWIMSWYFYAVAFGISQGFLLLIFVPVLWGDLSEYNSRERYYAIGSIPFFAANVIQALSTEYVALVPVYASSSLASFFLFLAVLSLAFAQETLPEKEIEKKRLSKYIEAAKKIKEKHEK